jgi:hypothetical protein
MRVSSIVRPVTAASSAAPALAAPGFAALNARQGFLDDGDTPAIHVVVVAVAGVPRFFGGVRRDDPPGLSDGP